MVRTSRADRHRIARDSGSNMSTAEHAASNSIRTRYDRTTIAMVADAEHILTQPGFDSSVQLENYMTHWASKDLGGCTITEAERHQFS